MNGSEANRSGIRGVIFDMDGVLVDSEQRAWAFWGAAFRASGSGLGREHFVQMIGRTEEQSLAMLRGWMGENEARLQALLEAKERFQREWLSTPVPVKPGAAEAVRWLEGLAVPMAVATSTRRAVAIPRLEEAALLERMGAVVCGDEVSAGKPAPDIFREASRRIGLPPASCAVFEDSEPGIRAAAAAGCHAVLVPDMHPVTEAMRTRARAVLASLLALPAYLEPLLEDASLRPQ